MTIKPIILKACEETAQHLSELSNLDISMLISTDHDLRVANDWQKRDERLIWGGQPFWQRLDVCQFHISIKKKRAVLAVCKSQFENGSLTLDCFESRPDDNPLKGKVLRAFTDAHVLMSRLLEAQQIDVREPNSTVTDMLGSLGFDTSGPYPVMTHLHL